MSKTVCIECKQLEEWDKNIQKKIIEKHRDINVKYDDWDNSELEYWAEKLAGIGFDVKEEKWKDERNYIDGKWQNTGKRVSYTEYNIAYTGFWSQGDGASFTGTVDISKWIETQAPVEYARIKKLIDSGKIDYSAEIKRDRWHHYVHWNSTSLYIDWNYIGDYKADLSNITKLLNKLEADILSHHQDLNREIYSDLEKDYDGQVSDEAVKETLIANEYEFDENGSIM